MEFSLIIETNDSCVPGQCTKVGECHAVQRMAAILACYKEWCQESEDQEESSDAVATYQSAVYGNEQLKLSYEKAVCNDGANADAEDEAEEEEEEPDGFYVYMASALNYASDKQSVSVKLVNDYTHLLMNHNTSNDFEALNDFFASHLYDGKGCSYGQCKMLLRNNRDRQRISDQAAERTRLYHGYSSSNEIIVQQTVDRIHCHYLHSYDLGFKLTRAERQQIVDIADNEADMEAVDDDSKEYQNDEDDIINTRRLRTVCEVLKTKRERDGRRARNARSNKFTTIVDDSGETAVASVAATGSDDDGDLMSAIPEENGDDEMSNAASKKKEKKAKTTDDHDHDMDELRVREVVAKGSQYSFSYRFFYWKAYLQTTEVSADYVPRASSIRPTLKGMKKGDGISAGGAASVGVGGSALLFLHDDDDEKTKHKKYELEPGNPGYETWDWYVPKKYKDLKSEITSNACCSIGIEQWNDNVAKAEVHLQSEHVGKKLKSYGEWIYHYDIPDDSPIALEHVAALLLYCNFDTLQAKFSETFRRWDAHEPDDSLKKRHREFANLGRYLREAVELYGTNISGQYSDEHGETKYNFLIKNLKFYHGINCELLLPRTIARFYGPTSTTTTIQVAMTFANSHGLCLQLKRKDPEYKHSSFFNCVPLSDFPYEEERLFIGGFEPLQIATIIETKSQTNHRRYVKALNNIQNFVEGLNDGYAIHKVTTRMKEDIEAMFRGYGMRKYDAKRCKIPEFVLNLFRAYAASVHKIDLNLEALNCTQDIRGRYGFSNIRDLIMIERNDIGDRQWVKLDFVGNIFRSVHELHIRSGHSVNMIKLNRELMDDLLGFIRSNNVIERFQNLTKIYIYHPEQSKMKLSKAIKKYANECLKHKWQLSYEQQENVRTLKLDRNTFNILTETVETDDHFVASSNNSGKKRSIFAGALKKMKL